MIANYLLRPSTLLIASHALHNLFLTIIPKGSWDFPPHVKTDKERIYKSLIICPQTNS